jgi:hypothetical protein
VQSAQANPKHAPIVAADQRGEPEEEGADLERPGEAVLRRGEAVAPLLPDFG